MGLGGNTNGSTQLKTKKKRRASDLHDRLFRKLIENNLPQPEVPREDKYYFREVAVGISREKEICERIMHIDFDANLKEIFKKINKFLDAHHRKQIELNLIDRHLLKIINWQPNQLGTFHPMFFKFIDYVCVVGETAWVIEGKRKLNYEAVGQVNVLSYHFSRDYPHFSVRKAIVCEESDPLIEEYCEKFNIAVFNVDQLIERRTAGTEDITRHATRGEEESELENLVKGHEWREYTVERVKECPECHSKNLVWDHERAELFCSDCGLVIDKNLVNLGPEWQDFDFEQATHDEVGTLLTSKYVLSWGHMTPSERYALSEIDRMASALGLPMDLREAAAELYRKVKDKIRGSGCSIEGITSAILYITCRQYGVPRTLEEIKAVSRVPQSEISRAYRFLLRELDIHLPPASPIEFVPRFCSRLGLGGDVRAKAIEIIKKAQEKKLTEGKGPIGVAAAAIYIAAILSGKLKTQKEISEATGVTEVTIRNRYRELSEKLDIKLDIILEREEK